MYAIRSYYGGALPRGRQRLIVVEHDGDGTIGLHPVAFLHNVMPLIAEAEHGTFFGVMGQRGPTHEELQDLQDKCAGDMNSYNFV